MSGIGESNPSPQLGKLVLSRSTNPALPNYMIYDIIVKL